MIGAVALIPCEEVIERVNIVLNSIIELYNKSSIYTGAMNLIYGKKIIIIN